MMSADPHRNQPVLQSGAKVEGASGAVILLHGRGASAASILSLADALRASAVDERIAFLAPQAAGSTWYPNSFLAPRKSNEPWLSSALSRVESIVNGLVEAGLGRERMVLCGFSQGACLATEFVASHPTRYAGLIAFTGGLIGPPGSDLSHTGELEGTPALLASGDPDPHVPWSRVQESAAVLEQMGAQVNIERYPGRPHTISEAEFRRAQALLASIFSRPTV
jgi:predicted esterase